MAVEGVPQDLIREFIDTVYRDVCDEMYDSSEVMPYDGDRFDIDVSMPVIDKYDAELLLEIRNEVFSLRDAGVSDETINQILLEKMPHVIQQLSIIMRGKEIGLDETEIQDLLESECPNVSNSLGALRTTLTAVDKIDYYASKGLSRSDAKTMLAKRFPEYAEYISAVDDSYEDRYQFQKG